MTRMAELAAAHLGLAAAALALALLIAAPMVLLMRARPRLRWPLLGAAGIVQTIPTLALLALFFPVLIALRTLTDVPIPALGFLPALLALALYALLPMLRAGLNGLTGVDPDIVEAADGLGMTPRQKLLQVELPLAAPVIMAGIRTAAVWTIGAATLATAVGQPSLGDLIFAGLQTEDWNAVLTGCLAAAALALAVDGLLALLEAGVTRRSRPRLLAGCTGLVLLGAAALVPGLGRAAGPVVVVGAKNFSEQYILAELVAGRLREAGYRVEIRSGLGSAIAFRALAAGEIDVYVDYAGTLWTNVLGRTGNPPNIVETVRNNLKAAHNVAVAGPMGFENAYAMVVRPELAARYELRTIADLARVAPRLTLGHDLEFLSRPEWPALRDAYGLRFKATRAHAPTFMYRALSDGSSDVITAFSSDGRIAADGLVVLADPRRAIPRYDALLLLAPRAARDARLAAVLKPFINSVNIEAMRAANYSVDRDLDKRSPAEAARALARQRGVGTRRPAILVEPLAFGQVAAGKR